jgi:hypothetical protein
MRNAMDRADTENQKGVSMEMHDEEYTNMEIENLITKGVVKGDTKRFLWHVGTAVVIGFLAAVLLGLSGLPAHDSAHRGDFAGAKILKNCAAKRIPGC